MKKTILTSLLLSAVLFSCTNENNVSFTQSDRSTKKDFKLFTTSNTTGNVSVTNLNSSLQDYKSFTVASVDADGAYYFPNSDEFVFASRTNNRLELYNNVSMAYANNSTMLNLFQTSASDFTNPREIAVYEDKIVVTQDQSPANLNTNKLIVYQKSNSGLTLINSYTVNFKIWGIHLDRNTLYAVADLTSDLVVFENFFNNQNGYILPTKRVTIEGLVRTHGITYAKESNTMVLTDVGSAASDTDGGVIVIKGFTGILDQTPNMGTIGTNNQSRIYGVQTLLGNPVDVAYDHITKRIYVAERLNGGGRLLVFDSQRSNSNSTPIEVRNETGISSVYLYSE